MWWKSAPIAALALAGCGQPDVDGCEQFIKSGLQAPATYNRVSIQTSDRPSSADEIRKLGGVALGTGEYMHYGLRSVAIQYDAANAYGTPIRSSEVCLFPLSDGKLRGDARSLASTVEMHENARSFRGLAAAGAIPNIKPGEVPPPQGPSCCM